MGYRFADLPNFVDKFTDLDFRFKVKSINYGTCEFTENDDFEVWNIDTQQKFIEFLWKIVCKEYEISTDMYGDMNCQIEEIDELIREAYGSVIDICGDMYDTADALYMVDGNKYNLFGYDFVYGLVNDFLETIATMLEFEDAGYVYKTKFMFVELEFTRLNDEDSEVFDVITK